MSFIPENKTNKFKDRQGRFLTKGLFFETSESENVTPLYTLADEEKRGLPSAKQIYIEAADPSEYKAAMALLGSWQHWERLISCDWFQPYLEEWRAELELKLRSRALESIVNQSQAVGKDAMAAARYIVEGSWKNPTKRGRPSKDEIKREARMQADLSKDMDETMKRLGLN